MSDNYLHQSISSKALSNYLKKNAEININIIAIEVFEKNELMLKYAPKPFSCSQKGEVYSMSKSFTSIAVGIAIDEGLLTLDDYFIDFFPDECPENVSENMKALQIKHLLSMNSGQDECFLADFEASGDSVKYFFNLPQPYKPGTHFFYNNGATHMLSAIITKVTGLSLLDYANIKFLHGMGIHNVKWRRILSKYTTGASAINVSCDDIAKLGLLFFNKGVYNGKRYVSEKWIEQATVKQSDNSHNTNPDWSVGYGYKIWINKDEGYRGDGAFGQLMVVFPEKEVVVAVRAESRNIQEELNIIKQFVIDMHSDTEEVVALPDSCQTLEPKDKNFSYENIHFRLDNNEIGASFLNISKDNDDLMVKLSTSDKTFSFKAGNNHYIDSDFVAGAMRPSYAWRYIGNAEEEVSYSCCYNIENDVINIMVKSLNSPHSGNIKFTFDEETRNIKMEFIFNPDVLMPNMREITGTEYK